MALGNVTKSGLAALPEAVNIEAEAVEVEELEGENGESVVTFGASEEQIDPSAPYDHYENLADTLPDEERMAIAMQVFEGFTADKDSRSEWERTLQAAVPLLGLKGTLGEVPFTGACDAVHPLIVENVVKFQSKATQELLPPGGPVRTQIVGARNELMEGKAQRVKEFMNFQLTTLMPEYYEEEEKALFYLPFAGVAFKKLYWNEAEDRPCSEFLRADDLVVNALAPSLLKATRITHIIQMSKVDFDKAVASGTFRDVELGTPSTPEISPTAEKMNDTIGVNMTTADSGVYTLYEQHCYLDTGTLAADDGTALPYVATIDKDTLQLLSLRRGWRQGDAKKKRRRVFVKKDFVPTDNFYSIGYAHMLGQLTRTITAAMRTLVDAGQFACLQGGFKLKGVKVTGDNMAIKPGEWRDIEVPGGTDIRQILQPIQYKEPSPALLEMLQLLVGAGQKFADTTDQVVSESTNYGPVGTTKAQKEELEILAEINEEHLPPEGYPYDVVGGDRTIARADFDAKVDVMPVSDPNIVSQAQRAALAQAVAQIVEKAPQLHDVKHALRYLYTTMNVPEVDKLLPPAPQPQQQDPVSDLMSAVRGQPIGAFPGQDHDAHIGVKSAWLQDPLQGANPIMQAAGQAIAANIREHMVLKFQEQVGGFLQMGQQQGLPPEAAEKIMVEAAKKILEADVLMSELQNAEQVGDAADNIIKLKELKLKEKELEHDAKRDAAQLSVRNRQLDVQSMNIQLKAATEGVKLGTKFKTDQQSQRAKMATEAVKTLVALKDIESNERITEKQMEVTERIATKKAAADKAKAAAAAKRATKPKPSGSGKKK
jgi:hypothetical protein